MRIATKLQLLVALGSVLLIACAFAGFSGVVKLSDTLDFVSGPAWDTADGAMEGTIAVQAQMLAVDRLTTNQHHGGEDAARQQLKDGRALAAEAFDRMKSAQLLEPGLLKQLDDKLAAYDAARDEALSDSAGEHALHQYHDVADELLAFVGELEETADSKVENEAAAISAVQATSKTTLLVTAVLGLLLFAAAAVYGLNYIIRPMRKFTEGIKDLAAEIGTGKGDLTHRFPVHGGDELAQLATGVNVLVEQLGVVVRRVDTTSRELSDSARDLSTLSEQANHGVQQQRDEIEQAATAMEQMAASAREVADSAGRAADGSRNADQEARKGSDVVSATVGSINKLAMEIQAAGEVVRSLDTESENIGKIINVIRGIAEQTNLLALNAAIEAARAGESGRGFAVVADEVRTLAGRTQEATKEIQDLIARLQGGAKQAVIAMENSGNQTQSSVEQATDAGETLSSIVEAIATISDMNNQIAGAAEQQTSAVANIASNIAKVAGVLDRTADGAQNTAQRSDELSSMAEKLRKVTEGFNVG